MIRETGEQFNDVVTLTDTFRILDPSTNIEIIITPIYMIKLQSIIDLIPKQTSLQSHQSLLSELSNDKSAKSVVEPVMHIFKSSTSRLRRNGYWLCKLKFGIDDKFNHWGVVFPMMDVGTTGGTYLGVFKINGPVAEDKRAGELYRVANEADLINVGEETPKFEENTESTMASDDAIESFSMKPPISMETKKGNSHNVEHDTNDANNALTLPNFTSPSKRDESQDPLQFLNNRYYHSLYSLNEPLSYFPKASLTRFKNLCHGDVDSVASILDLLISNMEKFDSRYDGKSNGEFFLHDKDGGDVANCEMLHQEKLKQRVGFTVRREMESGGEMEKEKLIILDGIDNDKLQRLMLELKVREAQLQLILLFEVFQNWNINEDDFLSHNLQKLSQMMLKQSQEQKKVSLVRIRKRRKLQKDKGNEEEAESKKRKRVKPTTLLDQSTLNGIKNREFAYYLYLNKLIDRLNLWEVLLAPDNKQVGSPGVSSANDSTGAPSSSSSYGFLAYVLVPYYGKTLPVLMKYVILNMKNTNMKLISNHKKQKKASQKKKGHSAGFDKVDSNGKTNGNGETKKHGNFERKPLFKNDSASGELIKDISIASLKRSKSSLGGQTSRELLDKRQVDLNFKPPHLKKQISSNADSNGNQSSSSSLASSSLIFGQAWRSKTLAGGETLMLAQSRPGPESRLGSTSIVNVAETPMKAGQQSTLPLRGAGNGTVGGGNGSLGGNMMKSVSQIEATPAKQRIIDLEIFTPISKPKLNSTESTGTRQDQATDSIFTSPVTGDYVNERNGRASPFLKPGSSLMTQRLHSVASGAVGGATSVNQGQQYDVVAATPKKQTTDKAPCVIAVTPNDMIVEATPVQNERKSPQLQKLLDVQATPVQDISKLQSSTATLIEATPNQGAQQKIQSPFVQHLNETDVEFKSLVVHKNGAFTTPSAHKTKPGDAIAISESPIYNAYATAGLLSLRNKDGDGDGHVGGDDEGYDSDEILNPKKKKARATYSRR